MTLTMILAHTPMWVWTLLTALLALGLVQSRTRRVRPARLLLLPLLLLALGLWTMWRGFVALPAAGGLWLAALLTAAALAQRLPVRAGSRWLADEQRLLLPGSWVPLLLVVTVFGVRYALAVAVSLHPLLATAARVVWPSALLFGLLAGGLLGRSLALLRLPRVTVSAHAAA